MADFKTHVAGGVVVGVGFAGISLFFYDLNIIQSFAVFIMGLFGAILPDLDSDSGKPLALISGMLSVLIPVLLLSNMNTINISSPEFLISYFTSCYLVINYLICGLIKKMTVHRGIMHSIPFSFLSAEIIYILFVSSGKNMATIAALAIFFGCLMHLVLDEVNSLNFKFGIIPMLTKSSGSAFKLYSSGFLANSFMFISIIGVTLLIFDNMTLTVLLHSVTDKLQQINGSNLSHFMQNIRQ